ncbi:MULTISPECIES: hypothetical protein [Vibrio]|uniref:hypothetical protein n=1 Tax=Vibrio TaxID=662 RepID=UPI00078DE8E8|nr:MULTISPECIES: hypothetical protein [Vibrio]BAU71063.1 hypothetical protein [Vibrio sp. 04Ya108]BBM67677.1 hypothetical protein VA249_43230 [Vibrio alfacsensis]BCN27174.1 hypothetical protein VYA_43660 [Vibrio alfacsensis]
MTVKCRGYDTRKRLVNAYFIQPVAHVKLLSGQKKASCTKDILTDSYYCFSYQGREDEEDTGTFFCGIHAARDFLSLTGHEPIKLFNPLKTTPPVVRQYCLSIPIMPDHLQ